MTLMSEITWNVLKYLSNGEIFYLVCLDRDLSILNEDLENN